MPNSQGQIGRIYFLETLSLNSPNYSPGNPHRIKDLLCSRGRLAGTLAAVISVSPIRSWLAEAGTGDLGVRAGPESLELRVRCGGLG